MSGDDESEHGCMWELKIAGSACGISSESTGYTPGVLSESVEHWSRVREIVGSNPGRVKPMTINKIDTCRFIAWCSAILG